MTTHGPATIPADPEPVLGAGAEFEGTLCFRGTTRVDGRLVGDVVGNGTLRLGERGEVHGRVEVDELVTAGTIEGDVAARRRIELSPTARIRGGLTTSRLVLAPGARLDGPCRTGAVPEEGPETTLRSS